MRIGIIGAGISGMAAAWMLQDEHQVTLFDQNPRLGGHVETLPITVDGHTVDAELGPRFFFDASYPYFVALLDMLGVRLRWVEARVSFTDLRRGSAVVMPPRSLHHLAAYARDPRIVRHMLSLRRLIDEQPAVSRARDYTVSFQQYLAQRGFPPSFGPELVYPFLAACWGTSIEHIMDFPAYSLLKGMPRGTRVGFYEVEGGMAHYIRALGNRLGRVDVRVGTRVRRIDRRNCFFVEDAHGGWHPFDQLVVATPTRDAASLLGGVACAKEMRAAVAAFGHFDVEIAIHGDPSFMPRDRRDWCHNNLFVDGGATWMTDWQGIGSGAPVFRTWLPEGRAQPSPLYARRHFHHVLMTPENAVLQRRIAAVQGDAGLWVTGMYAVDIDNHESALLSAIVPVRALSPRSKNLRSLLAKVGDGACHDLGVLPEPLSSETSAESLRSATSPRSSIGARARGLMPP